MDSSRHGSESSADTATYPYKNEVSLSIGDDSSTIAAPTPSPRHIAPMEDIPLTKSSPEMRTKTGFDNPAFDKRPLSSFGQNGNGLGDSKKSGSLPEKNGKEKPVEAVNLELVNMNGNGTKNGRGSPKKDTEVHIGDPYDEYFVPVNEHRKYMSYNFNTVDRGVDGDGRSRKKPIAGLVHYEDWIQTTLPRGEKLYVTKDKRISKSKGKKYLWWFICLALVLALVIIALLAATGVIFKASPTTPVESRTFGDNKMNINSAGFIATGNRTDPPKTPIPTDLTDTVPNVVQGNMTFKNMKFRDEYSDPIYPEYKQISESFTRELKRVLEENEEVEDTTVTVVDLKPGSVVVEYRVSWKPKDNETDSDMKWVEKSIGEYLSDNGGYMMNQLVDIQAVQTNVVKDQCLKNSMNCPSQCSFSYSTNEFYCVDEFRSSHGTYRHPEEDDEEKHSSHGSAHFFEKEDEEEDDKFDRLQFDPDHISETSSEAPEPSSEPEPVGEPEPISEKTSTTDKEQIKLIHDVSSEPEPKGEPEPEPTSEPEPVGEPEPTSEKTSTTDKEQIKLIHDASFEPESKGEPEPEPTSEPEPVGEPEPTSEKTSTTDEEQIKLIHDVSTEPEPKGEPEPTSDVSMAEATPTTLPTIQGFSSTTIDHENKSNLSVVSLSSPETTSEQSTSAMISTSTEEFRPSSEEVPHAAIGSHDYYGVEDHAFSDFNEDSDKHVIESEYVFHPTNEPDDLEEMPIESEEFYPVSPVYSSPPRRGPAVTEEILEDTPTTEKIYIPIVTHSDDLTKVLENATTATPVTPSTEMNFTRDSISHEMELADMSPFLPNIEQMIVKSDQADSVYEVTESVSEIESAKVQVDLSPFLPEIHEQNQTEKAQGKMKEKLTKSFRMEDTVDKDIVSDKELPNEPKSEKTVHIMTSPSVVSTTEAVTNSLEEEDHEENDFPTETSPSISTSPPEAPEKISVVSFDDHDSNLNEIHENGYKSDEHLKVIPLSATKWNKPIAAESTTESFDAPTTAHFLGDRTFPSTESSIGTSHASDVDLMAAFFKCLTGQFECKNGTSIDDATNSCISSSKRCDANLDCLDGSDEVGCEDDGCPGHFQCSDRKCLARHLVCDGISHCSDSGDELHCADWICRYDEFPCAVRSGPCLPNTWQCDGLDHCRNGADESNCPDACSNSEFFCSTQGRCIPDAWRCDGKSDCLDAEDERLCDCGPEQRKCKTGGGCYNGNDTCNGVSQCSDGSDEWNCLTLEDKAHPEVSARMLSVKSGSDVGYKVCADNWSDKASDSACSQLGFGDHLYWTMTNSSGDGPFNRLQSNASWSFNLTDTCKEGVVALTCDRLRCSSNLAQLTTPMFAVNRETGAKCAATIVSSKWALSSYSCIIGSGTKLSNNANWILTNETDGMNYTISRKLPYPQTKFQQIYYENNFILLEIERSPTHGLLYATCITSEPLASNATCRHEIVSQIEGSSTNSTQKSSYEVISKEICNATFSGLLTSSSVCISQPPETSCKHGSTEPLLCKSQSTGYWKLYGLSSYDDNCGRHNHPQIYSVFSEKIIDWIANTIGNREMILL